MTTQDNFGYVRDGMFYERLQTQICSGYWVTRDEGVGDFMNKEKNVHTMQRSAIREIKKHFQ